jgi:hypothetical protein
MMKKISFLTLVMLLNTAPVFSSSVNPLDTLEANLRNSVQRVDGRKSLSQMKALANEKNVDVEVAFQNYIIAKKNISVARAAFNPLTTGHLLGLALGLNYLWAPIAVEAVLSIPMKIHNVEKNTYLEKASVFNLYDAREVLNNEMAHLYYDILTHEAILKSIDQEILVLSFHEGELTKRKAGADRIEDTQRSILEMSLQRVDIYNLYSEEVTAVRTLLMMNDQTPHFDLAHVPGELSKSVISGLDTKKLENFALVNSNKYKVKINMHRASLENIKAVKWSILSRDGLNFSYKKRIKIAKNEENIALLEMQSTEEQVKNLVKLQLKKFDSSLDVFNNYDQIAGQTMELFHDSLKAYEAGIMSEDSAIDYSLSAIRDFRNYVVAHYASWSAMDDFSEAANYSFEADGHQIEAQLEHNPMADLSSSDFNVAKTLNNGVKTIKIVSKKKNIISSVDYRFSNPDLLAVNSENADDGFIASVKVKEGSSSKGTAAVHLKNGFEYELSF